MLESHWPRAVLAAFLLFVVSLSPTSAAVDKESPVQVSHRKDGKIEYVVGKIRIPYSPDKVWPILSNPFEFEQKISPKFKTVRIESDRPDYSLLHCRVDVGFFLPAIKYSVASTYQNQRQITFQSTGGDLKDFRGNWEIAPVAGGTECDVTYSMYVQPGLPIPQWLVKQAIRIELPHTLQALKNRIEQVYEKQDPPVSKRLAASAPVGVL